MSDITNEIKKRRTFAIISHPDAGKTTLTEKFLLYGGAINQAGSVKGKATAKHAVSDWMEIEKERGISVTSSVLQFNYGGYCINILDTPGHQDFSEDTYRTLMAADSAVMVIDASKGVEAQTRKLFKVCVMRHIPIFTFINKMDREARDTFELLDDIEKELGIATCPVNWPIGSGKAFKGVYDRAKKEVELFSDTKKGTAMGEVQMVPIDAPETEKLIGADAKKILADEIELLDGASAEFDQELVDKGQLSPVFFGSALTNFGVETFLKHFLKMTTSPLPRMSDKGEIDPMEEKDFSAFVFKIQDILRRETDLFFEKRVPQRSPQFNEEMPIMDQIEKEDKLLSYPYESMRPFLKMLQEAAEDKDVVSIKMTLYRVAKQSKIIASLIEAAENGKDVTILVELKARFDEENNIEWSRQLEDAGCRVIYGLDGYKVHSKLCLITRKKQGKVGYITQIGTGNYNEKTSRLYTDLSLMTANVDIALEAAEVFQALSMGETVESVDHLLVAPHCLQNKVIHMIDREIEHAKIGESAYIGLKMNSLTDKKIMQKLVEASKAGVKIDMVIRGICCLIPGVKGETDNIQVRSIVGRYLEHSRIYIFGTKGREKVYIASADFMTRNTLRRVEVAVPIYNTDIKMQLIEMFITMLSDNVKAREEDHNGNYKIPKNQDTPLNSQEFFYKQAYLNAKNVNS